MIDQHPYLGLHLQMHLLQPRLNHHSEVKIPLLIEPLQDEIVL